MIDRFKNDKFKRGVEVIFLTHLFTNWRQEGPNFEEVYKVRYSFKFRFIAFACLLTLFLFSQSAAAVVDVDVGTVNLQEVIDAHPEADEIEEEMQSELMQLEQEFQSQAQAMEEEDPQAIQQMQQQMQQQAEIIQQQKMEEMMNIIQPEMDEFREEEELDLILMNESVLSGGEDITEELIDFIQ